MGENFLANYIFVVSLLLFAIGFALLIFNRNLVKKIIGLDIMDSGTYLFLASMGYISDSKVPIIDQIITSADGYVNPIPSGLVLTGIVVSVSVSAIMLALCIRLYKKYHTLDLDKIYILEKRYLDHID